MIDLLFTHSYFLHFDPKEYRAMMPYPPLGTLYAAAVARDAGYSVALFDAMLASSEEEVYDHLVRHEPRFLVIYDDDFNYLTKMCLTRMREAACRMAEVAKRRGCTVIVHGSDATDHLDEYFDRGVDYILCGEGEITLRELLESVTGRSDRSPESIPGVALRDADGTIRRGPPREVLRDLDTLPMPARDLVDIDLYRRVWMKHHGYFSLNLVTTRGCPFHCNWCAKPLYGQVYNVHSPARVATEMRMMKERWNPDHIWICDDIFGLKPGWVQTFADEVTSREGAIPFKCLSRADLVIKEGVAQALMRAGCRTVWIGAESGSQTVLDAMDKGITIAQIHRATAKLRAMAIRVGYFLQLGYPGETAREIELTVKMLRRSQPDEIGISVSYPLPGTRFYERVKSEMGEKRNWTESGDLAMMFRGTFSTEFYRRQSQYLHMDHRLHQGFIAFRMWLSRSPLSRADRRRLLLIPYYRIRRDILSARLRRLRRSATSQGHPLPVVQTQS